MKKLRIATLFTELGIGGDENRALYFAQAVDRERFEPYLVTLVEADEQTVRRFGPMTDRYRDAGVRCLTLREQRRGDFRPWPQPLSALRDAARTLRIAARLAALFRRERIDVLDARMTYNMVVGLLAARMARLPVTLATEYYNDWWGSAPWRWLAPAIFDGFDAFITDSRWALEQYRRDLRRDLAGAMVVPNGVPEPRSSADRAQVRRALGLPVDATVVAQVARVVRYKGQLQLVRAAARVLEQAPDTWFLICGYANGDPEFTARLQQEIAALGVAHRVRLAPWPGDIAEVWRAVDIHAHPSLLDSSPIAIHESMALGLPLVASSTGGIPELVEHEVTGLIVPPDQPKPLADALLRLLAEPATRVRLGVAARRRYVERHRPAQMTRTLEQLMIDIYERKRGPLLMPAPRLAVAP